MLDPMYWISANVLVKLGLFNPLYYLTTKEIHHIQNKFQNKSINNVIHKYINQILHNYKQTKKLNIIILYKHVLYIHFFHMYMHPMLPNPTTVGPNFLTSTPKQPRLSNFLILSGRIPQTT